jgi:uncharacterized protein
MDKRENRTEIRGVPCITLAPPAEPVGRVVLMHGWGSTNESYLFFASLVAGWGYEVIVPELPLHGDRGTLNYWEAETLQANFWQVIVQSVRETGNIVAALARDSDLPVTMIGHSAGGFISAGTFAGQPGVRSAIVINGSCAWVRFEERYREQSGLPAMSRDEQAALAEHDPFGRLLALPEKPLLLLHGLEDTIVPVGSQNDFVEAAAERGSDAVQFHTFERVNHQITLGMLQRIHAFLLSGA